MSDHRNSHAAQWGLVRHPEQGGRQQLDMHDLATGTKVGHLNHYTADDESPAYYDTVTDGDDWIGPGTPGLDPTESQAEAAGSLWQRANRQSWTGDNHSDELDGGF